MIRGTTTHKGIFETSDLDYMLVEDCLADLN